MRVVPHGDAGSVAYVADDIHGAISNARPGGQPPWWDVKLFRAIDELETTLGRTLTRDEVLHVVDVLLRQIDEWSPK
jgi:hypothetical protein